ncbi:MAG: 50S ribosomal protein L22 [Gemmatimonadetes bacterium]|nr:50S ribosomal protein L22 [Gemmatimonadota bacterium]
MEARAQARHAQMSPRKMRLVVDLIRGMKVEEAFTVLQATQKRASPVVEKTLRSAVANALYVREDDDSGEVPNVDDLYVTRAFVDGGPMMKRFRPGPMGRVKRVRKRSSHLTIVVSEKKR